MHAHERRAWRLGSWSRTVDLRAFIAPALVLVCTLVVALLSLSAGKHWIAVGDVLRVLAGGGNEGDAFVIGLLRAPRVAMAALAGGALAVSGLILQSLVRNPLASPDVLGVNSGASAFAVCYLSFFAGTYGTGWLPLVAIAGAWLTGALVYGLAWRGGVAPLRLVLTGVGIGALMASATTLMLVFSPLASTMSAYVWLTGSVFGATWPDIARLAGWIAAAALGLVPLARHAVVGELDDAFARGLGQRVEWVRLGLLTVAVALAGAAVSCAGALAFVGLVAPHLARRWAGRGFGAAAWTSAGTGALLVMLADLAGRLLFMPRDLPAGIFVAALGAAFFVYLLLRQRLAKS